MSIADQITRIKNNIAASYAECSAKGATLPAEENSENLPNTIASITGGGSGGGDEITCVNEAGKTLMAGDKVWINSASQVGGTDTQILNGYYYIPIISPSGKYLYVYTQITCEIYQVIDNKVQLLSKFAPSDTSSDPTYFYRFMNYRYKNNSIYLSASGGSLFLGANNIFNTKTAGVLGINEIVATPASRFIFHRGDNTYLEEFDINTGKKISNLGENSSYAYDLFQNTGKVLLEDKYFCCYNYSWSDKRKILEVDWNTKELTTKSESCFYIPYNPHLTLDEEFIIGFTGEYTSEQTLVFLQKQGSLSYQQVSYKDINEDINKYFLNKSNYTTRYIDYDDISQTLYLYSLIRSGDIYKPNVLIVRYNPSVKKWLTINNEIFKDTTYKFETLAYISFTSNLDAMYYNNSTDQSLYYQKIYQLQLETKTGLRANSYSDYFNKESTLTGYVSTGGDVNENITVQTVLPPKINQTISVNADNATIEVEL